MKYVIWNNKGGTGKTSLSFQIICEYAHRHPDTKILAIDLCPQANLSEIFLGGLVGKGSAHLQSLYNSTPRISAGGYFQSRLPSPFTPGIFNPNDYIISPSLYNHNIPHNISLLPGDKLLELQSTALSTLSNANVPGVDTRLAILNWIEDFIAALDNQYCVFIDSNPSFSIVTQIALRASDRIIIPVMADDSSKRAIANVFTLVYGINVPNPIYNNYLFSSCLNNANIPLPKIHFVIRNRITQYMGEASAYAMVLNQIADDIQALCNSNPNCFTFTNVHTSSVSVKDFGVTGVVSFAEGNPFYNLGTGNHQIGGRNIQINRDMLDSCISAINSIVNNL